MSNKTTSDYETDALRTLERVTPTDAQYARLERAIRTTKPDSIKRRRAIAAAMKANAKDAPKATTITFVATGPFSWGRGSTVAEAVRRCKKHFRSIPRDYVPKGRHLISVVKVVGTFDGVDGMGRVHYRGKLSEVAPGVGDAVVVR